MNKLVEEIIEKILTAEEKGDSTTIVREKIFSDVMNKKGIPDDNRNIRESYAFAVKKHLDSYREKRKAEVERRETEEKRREAKLRERVLAKPSLPAEKTTELALDDQFTDDILEGRVSKEDLEDHHFKYRGKKPEDFYFGPPR